MQIFFENNDELAEFEAESKGYRKDVYVKIGNDFFNVNIYDPTRLIQDFESEVNELGYFQIDINLILVPKVTKIEITKILSLFERNNFFKHLKPLPEINEDKLKSILS